MEPRDVIHDIQASGVVLQPRLVLVQDHTVVQWFPAGSSDHALKTAETIAIATASPVQVYEVDARLPAPPAVGSGVDPQAQGWVEVEHAGD